MLTEEERREAKEEFDRIYENRRKELKEARQALLKLREDQEASSTPQETTRAPT